MNPEGAGTDQAMLQQWYQQQRVAAQAGYAGSSYGAGTVSPAGGRYANYNGFPASSNYAYPAGYGSPTAFSNPAAMTPYQQQQYYQQYQHWMQQQASLAQQMEGDVGGAIDDTDLNSDDSLPAGSEADNFNQKQALEELNEVGSPEPDLVDLTDEPPAPAGRRGRATQRHLPVKAEPREKSTPTRRLKPATRRPADSATITDLDEWPKLPEEFHRACEARFLELREAGSPTVECQQANCANPTVTIADATDSSSIYLHLFHHFNHPIFHCLNCNKRLRRFKHHHQKEHGDAVGPLFRSLLDEFVLQLKDALDSLFPAPPVQPKRFFALLSSFIADNRGAESIACSDEKCEAVKATLEQLSEHVGSHMPKAVHLYECQLAKCKAAPATNTILAHQKKEHRNRTPKATDKRVLHEAELMTVARKCFEKVAASPPRPRRRLAQPTDLLDGPLSYDELEALIQSAYAMHVSGPYLKCQGLSCGLTLEASKENKDQRVSKFLFRRHVFDHMDQRQYRCLRCPPGDDRFHAITPHLKKTHGLARDKAAFEDVLDDERTRRDFLEQLKCCWPLPSPADAPAPAPTPVALKAPSPAKRPPTPPQPKEPEETVAAHKSFGHKDMLGFLLVTSKKFPKPDRYLNAVEAIQANSGTQNRVRCSMEKCDVSMELNSTKKFLDHISSHHSETHFICADCKHEFRPLLSIQRHKCPSNKFYDRRGLVEEELMRLLSECLPRETAAVGCFVGSTKTPSPMTLRRGKTVPPPPPPQPAPVLGAKDLPDPPAAFNAALAKRLGQPDNSVCKFVGCGLSLKQPTEQQLESHLARHQSSPLFVCNSCDRRLTRQSFAQGHACEKVRGARGQPQTADNRPKLEKELCSLIDNCFPLPEPKPTIVAKKPMIKRKKAPESPADAVVELKRVVYSPKVVLQNMDMSKRLTAPAVAKPLFSPAPSPVRASPTPSPMTAVQPSRGTKRPCEVAKDEASPSRRKVSTPTVTPTPSPVLKKATVPLVQSTPSPQAPKRLARPLPSPTINESPKLKKRAQKPAPKPVEVSPEVPPPKRVSINNFLAGREEDENLKTPEPKIRRAPVVKPVVESPLAKSKVAPTPPKPVTAPLPKPSPKPKAAAPRKPAGIDVACQKSPPETKPVLEQKKSDVEATKKPSSERRRKRSSPRSRSATPSTLSTPAKTASGRQTRMDEFMVPRGKKARLTPAAQGRKRMRQTNLLAFLRPKAELEATRAAVAKVPNLVVLLSSDDEQEQTKRCRLDNPSLPKVQEPEAPPTSAAVVPAPEDDALNTSAEVLRNLLIAVEIVAPAPTPALASPEKLVGESAEKVAQDVIANLMTAVLMAVPTPIEKESEPTTFLVDESDIHALLSDLVSRVDDDAHFDAEASELLAELCDEVIREQCKEISKDSKISKCKDDDIDADASSVLSEIVDIADTADDVLGRCADFAELQEVLDNLVELASCDIPEPVNVELASSDPVVISDKEKTDVDAEVISFFDNVLLALDGMEASKEVSAAFVELDAEGLETLDISDPSYFLLPPPCKRRHCVDPMLVELQARSPSPTDAPVDPAAADLLSDLIRAVEDEVEPEASAFLTEVLDLVDELLDEEDDDDDECDEERPTETDAIGAATLMLCAGSLLCSLFALPESPTDMELEEGDEPLLIIDEHTTELKVETEEPCPDVCELLESLIALASEDAPVEEPATEEPVLGEVPELLADLLDTLTSSPESVEVKSEVDPKTEVEVEEEMSESEILGLDDIDAEIAAMDLIDVDDPAFAEMEEELLGVVAEEEARLETPEEEPISAVLDSLLALVDSKLSSPAPPKALSSEATTTFLLSQAAIEGPSTSGTQTTPSLALLSLAERADVQELWCQFSPAAFSLSAELFPAASPKRRLRVRRGLKRAAEWAAPCEPSPKRARLEAAVAFLASSLACADPLPFATRFLAAEVEEQTEVLDSEEWVKSAVLAWIWEQKESHASLWVETELEPQSDSAEAFLHHLIDCL